MGEAEFDCCGSMGLPSARRAEAVGNPCAADVAAAAVGLAVADASVVVAAAAAVAAELAAGLAELVEPAEPVVDWGRECACWAMRWNCCSLSGLRGMVRGRVVGSEQGRSTGPLKDLVKGRKSDLDNWQADVTTEHPIVAAATSTGRVQKSRSRSRSGSRGRSERSGRPDRSAARRRGGC